MELAQKIYKKGLRSVAKYNMLKQVKAKCIFLAASGNFDIQKYDIFISSLLGRRSSEQKAYALLKYFLFP